MRLAILALALLAFPVTGCTARVPNMTCKAVDHGVSGFVTGRSLVQTSDVPTDVFRIANGKVYHRWSKREEYFYNDIKEVDLGRYELGHRYMSGHMVFVLDDGNRSGYVVIAAPTDWQVYYLVCNS